MLVLQPQNNISSQDSKCREENLGSYLYLSSLQLSRKMGTLRLFQGSSFIGCRALELPADEKISGDDKQDAHNKDRVIFRCHAIAHGTDAC